MGEVEQDQIQKFVEGSTKVNAPMGSHASMITAVHTVINLDMRSLIAGEPMQIEKETTKETKVINMEAEVKEIILRNTKAMTARINLFSKNFR